MKILFYAAAANGMTDQLLNEVSSVVASRHVHISPTIGRFMQALLIYHNATPMVVIQVGSVADVAEINGFRDLLDGLFLVLVTNGRSDTLMAHCRRLYPRLVCQDTSDFKLITAVIEKRLAFLDSQNFAAGVSSTLTMESNR